jgi:prepilin-type N-terminal cleavage/methylation domain-containing protein
VKVLRKRLANIIGAERGFTLPEVMITIVIMGILAAIAVPSWFGVVEGRNVDSATNQLASDLRLAHTSATNRLAPARVEFSNTGAVVNCGGTSADYCLIQQTPGGGTQYLVRNFEGDVELTSPNLLPAGGVSMVKFAAEGSATAPGTLGTVSGVTDNCPTSTPTGVPRMQISVDGSPAHCITFTEATSRIQID